MIGGLTVEPAVYVTKSLLGLPRDANVYFRDLQDAKRYAAATFGAKVWRVVGETGAWVEVPPPSQRFATLFSGANSLKSRAFAAKNHE